jgi:hypothetical protein
LYGVPGILVKVPNALLDTLSVKKFCNHAK